MGLFKKKPAAPKKAASKAKAKVTAKKPVRPAAPKPKTVEQKMRADYIVGLNHNQLADKYNKTVEEVTEIIGA